MGLFNAPQGSKLHVGAGGKSIEGYINTDTRWHLSPDGVVFDLVCDPLPENRFSEIYACHVLEHVYRDLAPSVMDKLIRALQPGGVLRISVPDLRLIVRNCIDTHDFGDNPDAPLFGDYRSFAGEEDRHKRCYTQEILTRDMIRSGLAGIRRWSVSESHAIATVGDYASAETISLNLLGIKP